VLLTDKLYLYNKNSVKIITILSTQHEAFQLLSSCTLSLLEVTLSTREKRIRTPGIHPDFKGLLWFTDGPRTSSGGAGVGAGVYGQSLGRRLNISLRIYATVFQAEIYAIWHVLLKFKWTVDQRSTLVFGLTGRHLWKLFRLLQQQPIGTAVPKGHDWLFHPQFRGLFWVSGYSGIRGNEIADELAKEGTVQQFVGTEPALGVSRQITRRKIKLWIDNLHMAMWRGLKALGDWLGNWSRGPSPTSKTQVLAFVRTQSRVVNGPLTGPWGDSSTLWGWMTVPCKRCGEEEETSAHVLCECVALATLKT